MTNRNINLAYSGKRILGVTKTGVIGSLIPSTGDNGPAYAYPSLTLPADANTEICGYVTTMPAAGTFEATEDTAFTAAGLPDGVHTFQFQLEAFGIPVGAPRTATLTVGATGVTISCSPGNAAAGGLNATITTSGITTISCNVGNAAAAGRDAVVTQYTVATIACTVGDAVAVGPNATATQYGSVTITCTAGNAAAGGSTASVTNSGAIVYARSPHGNGYSPQRNEMQSRPAATQRNNR